MVKKTNETHYKIENIKTLKDLSFISNKKEIINNIILKPNNPLTKQLLYGNKISKKKCCIDLIGFGRPKFEGDEEFFNEVFNQVTSKNNLFINKTPLFDYNN